MIAAIPSSTMIQIKKYAYMLFALPMAFPVISWWAASEWGHLNLFAWGTVFFVFGVVPILDALLGQDPANPDEAVQVPKMEQEMYYRLLTLAFVPGYLALILWGAHIFTTAPFSTAGAIGWLLSVGTVGGLAITVAHELVHKDTRYEQWFGGILLSMICYGGFKVEHIRGHHVNVSTPEDASSARYNQSLYEFLPHAYLHNFLNAWKLQKAHLERKGLSLWSLKNELIWWYALSAAWLVLFTVLWGWKGAVFFLGQAFVSFTLLEIVNYLEHYGLHRRKLPNGRYERTRPEHSWNSNHLLSNLFLFHLQRHSDHHAYAKRRYQVLRHHDDAPQLPAGYPTMVLLALIPPLWKRVMNPRVEAYYQGELEQLKS